MSDRTFYRYMYMWQKINWQLSHGSVLYETWNSVKIAPEPRLYKLLIIQSKDLVRSTKTKNIKISSEAGD